MRARCGSHPNIAVGLVVRDGHALVEIYPATDAHGAFARAHGGGIEFGETADGGGAPRVRSKNSASS